MSEKRELLEKVASTLRTMSGELKSLREKVASYEKQTQATDLVARMEAQGLTDPDTPMSEKVAALLNSGKDLDLLGQALDLKVGNMSPVSVSDEPGAGDTDPLTACLIS